MAGKPNATGVLKRQRMGKLYTDNANFLEVAAA